MYVSRQFNWRLTLIVVFIALLIAMVSCGKKEVGIREQVVNNIKSVAGNFAISDTTRRMQYLLRYPDSLKVNITKSVVVKNTIDKTLNMVGTETKYKGLPEIVIDSYSWETPYIKVSMEHFAKHNIPDSSFIHIWIEKK